MQVWPCHFLGVRIHCYTLIQVHKPSTFSSSNTCIWLRPKKKQCSNLNKSIFQRLSPLQPLQYTPTKAQTCAPIPLHLLLFAYDNDQINAHTKKRKHAKNTSPSASFRREKSTCIFIRSSCFLLLFLLLNPLFFRPSSGRDASDGVDASKSAGSREFGKAGFGFSKFVWFCSPLFPKEKEQQKDVSGNSGFGFGWSWSGLLLFLNENKWKGCFRQINQSKGIIFAPAHPPFIISISKSIKDYI